MSSRWRSRAWVLAGVLLAAGSSTVLVRAASLTSRYDTEVQRLRQQWRTQQEAEGLSGSAQRKALYGKYPTPELRLAKVVSVAPGQSAKLSVSGTFPANTTFVMENDQVTLAEPVASATGFSATVTTAADAVPGFGRLFAYAPVSGAYTSVAAVFVGTPPSYALTASNGWTVKLQAKEKAFTLADSNATAAYVADFYKPGETTPFDSASGTWTIESRRPTDQLSMSLGAGESGAMAELNALQKQMGDVQAFMKMSDAKRDAFMDKLTTLTERVMQEQQAMVADPAEMQRKQDAFGCSYLTLTLQGPSVTGSVSCGKDVGRLDLTGTRQ